MGLPRDAPDGCAADTWTLLSSEDMQMEPCDDDGMVSTDSATYTPKDLAQTQEDGDEKEMLGTNPATYTPKDFSQTKEGGDEKQPCTKEDQANGSNCVVGMDSGASRLLRGRK